MRIPHNISSSLLLGLLLAAGTASHAQAASWPEIDFEPRTYQCVKAYAAPEIDGLGEDVAWQNAQWSDDFVDITGDDDLTPDLRTRMKMLWNDEYLFILAELEEPHIQGSLTDHDSVIYHDNDFELFIDPDADNHNYAELEINALGTVWDLLLTRPYRDSGNAVSGWDIKGLMSAVSLDGTVNDPSDTDTGWSVELAIPWSSMAELSGAVAPPVAGDRWRMNFSRVQHHSIDSDGSYERSLDDNGNALHPENWVWSPQGIVAMHCPEMWGIVEFAGGIVTPGNPKLTSEDFARQALMCMYYWQHDHKESTGSFSDSKVERWYDDYPLPDVDDFRDWLVQDAMWASTGQFRFSMSDGTKTISINEQGRISSFDGPLEELTPEELEEAASEEEPEVAEEVGPPEDAEDHSGHDHDDSVRSSTDGRNIPPAEED